MIAIACDHGGFDHNKQSLRIVTLATPFPPLPSTEENVDILHVTRTWQFLPGGEVRDD